MRVHHKLLKELASSFNLDKNTLETTYGSFRIKPSTIGAALGLNASGDLFPHKVSYKELSEENKQIFRRFKGQTLKNLTDEMMSIGVENEQDRMMFKRIFILYIQMAFLLPTTINKISPVHLTPIFKIDKITEGNWGAHVQSKKRKQVVEDSSAEQTQSYDGSELETEVLQEFLRKSKKKKTNEKNCCTGKKGAPLPSTEGHYDSSETIPEVNLGSENDPLSQGQINQSSINKPANSMLSLVEESANDPAEQNMMVVRVETQSQIEALSIVSIQVYVPLYQTTPVSAIELSPAKSPREKISEKRIEITPQPPKPDESTPTVPPTPSKINPTPEDAAALMMMARTASYIPKEGLMLLFSLGLTDSSQEEVATQEEQREKSLETPKLIEQLEELVKKLQTVG
ncbi:uncharacterized protein DS421_12g370610 [Arachis hypogaea]|nr:uncharacterized protein DS421_12g370610 [Arachis hypogaea]